MKIFFTSLCLTTCLVLSWGQDCGITIDLTSEVNLCAPGSSVLSPVITGSYSSFSWSPISGLTEPDELITTANVSDSITYTLSVLSLSGNNLITNGDFSMGDTGFTSDYVYGTGGGVGLLSNEGEYAIATNAGTTHNQFANCNDHTGGGNMMVVNASGDASNLWCQNIVVEANTDYFFSAWVASVTSQNPAQLQFSVNGLQLGTPFNASSTTCNWQQFSANWSSGATVDAEICIVNTNFTPAGNDFALDDIDFQAYCTTSASVAINVTELVSDINVPANICDISESISPDAYFTASTTPGGQWLLDGNAVSTFNPATLSNGTHVLEYNVSTAHCNSSSQGNFSLTAPPFAGTPDYFVSCFDPGVIYEANLAAVLQNEDLNGQWEHLSGPASATIDANNGFFSSAEAGNYVYMYIVSGNSICPNDTSFQTFDLSLNPVADLPATASLDCVIEEVTLTGPNTSVGNNIVYTWFQDNILLVDQFSIALDVQEPGLYLLEVRDENTNCTSTATTLVEDLSGTFSFDLIGSPAPCDDPDSGEISVSNIQGGTAPYLASIDGSTFIPTDQFTTLSPGEYEVTLQDAGGCEQASTIMLPSPVVPLLELQSSNNGEVVTLGTNVTISVVSNPPAELLDTLIWSPALPDSLRISDKQWIIQATETTTYHLTIRDENGCETESSIVISVRPDGAVFIPNAISPNEDGSNDRFVIYDKGAVSNISSLRIFDRWGALVYEALDLSPNSSDRAWDGKYQGKRLPSGVYIYALEVQWINGSQSQLQGEISIVY